MTKADMARAHPVAVRTTDPAEADAPPATRPPTAKTRRSMSATKSASSHISSGIEPSADVGSAPTSSMSASESPISKPSAKPPSGSNKQWRTPTTVRGLATQANKIATGLLNEEVDLEKAKAYSALVRSVAQMMSIEVARARFLRSEPVLDFEDEIEADS